MCLVFKDERGSKMCVLARINEYDGIKLGVLVWSRSAATPLMYMKRNGVVGLSHASIIVFRPMSV